MATQQAIHSFRSLSDLYASLQIPLAKEGAIGIYRLSDVHANLPFSSGLFRSEYYTFLFIKSGKGTYTVDDQEYKVRPYSLYFTNPGHLKSFHISNCDEVYLLAFSEEALLEYVHPEAFERYPFLLSETKAICYLSIEEFAGFEYIYLALFNEFMKENSGSQVMGKLFEAILIKCKSDLWPNRENEKRTDSPLLQQFKKLLESEFKKVLDPNLQYDAIGVQQYAERLNLHPNYFHTLIKNKSGKSPLDWIKERSLVASKTLLQHSTLSIKSIAYRLSYSDATHFSRFFKKRTGISPKEYRLSCRA